MVCSASVERSLCGCVDEVAGQKQKRLTYTHTPTSRRKLFYRDADRRRAASYTASNHVRSTEKSHVPNRSAAPPATKALAKIEHIFVVHNKGNCVRQNVYKCRRLIMVALCNRADHYIFALWLLSIYLSFFPRLISAAADWMPTILPHMVWP